MTDAWVERTGRLHRALVCCRASPPFSKTFGVTITVGFDMRGAEISG